MMQRFETRQWVPFPVELVFAFFADPSNLPRLMPLAQRARIDGLRIQAPPLHPSLRLLSLAAGTGSEIVISFCPLQWLPMRLTWTARIVEFEWNSHFVDEQIRGPFAQFRHRHGVVSHKHNGVQGTIVEDTVEFVLPAGLLGRLTAGQVRRQMKQGFDFRHKRLPEILAGLEPPAALDPH